MDFNIFLHELEESLVKRGVNPDVASKHVLTLQRTFTDEDLREIGSIQSPDEIEEIAENIALLLAKNKIKVQRKAPPAEGTAAPKNDAETNRNAPAAEMKNASDTAAPMRTSGMPSSASFGADDHTVLPFPADETAAAKPTNTSVQRSAERKQTDVVYRQGGSVQQNADPSASDIQWENIPLAGNRQPATVQRRPNPQRQNEEIRWMSEDEDDSFFEDYSGSDKTTKGFYTFWGIFAGTLPLTILLAVVFFGAFAAMFVGLTGILVAMIALLIGMVAAGVAVSLVGIIFGITQLFSFPAAGVYEIGLGVMIVGIVMFAGILIYNIAVRFIPWVMGKVAVLLKFTCGKIRDLFLYLRRECYRL